MFENIRQDYAHSTGKDSRAMRIVFRFVQDSGFRAVCFYRMGRWCRNKRFHVFAAIFERLMRHLCHCWISTLAEIGPGFRIAHVCGIIIPPDVIIGSQCSIRQNMTIGGNYGKVGQDGQMNPIIGNRVSIGPGAVILGPIRIGSDSIIGANAVVTKSVPEYSVVGAFRAEVLAGVSPEGKIQHDDKNMFISRKELFERLEMLEQKIAEIEEKNNRS